MHRTFFGVHQVRAFTRRVDVHRTFSGVHHGIQTQSGRTQNILWRAPRHSAAEWACTEHSFQTQSGRAQNILRCAPGRVHTQSGRAQNILWRAPKHSAAEWACTEHSFQMLTQNRTAEHHIIRFLKSRRYCGSFRFALCSMAVGKNPPARTMTNENTRKTKLELTFPMQKTRGKC